MIKLKIEFKKSRKKNENEKFFKNLTTLINSKNKVNF